MTTQQPQLARSAAPIDISIAHSPDSDDAFMFYGLATNKVRVPGYRFTHTLSDIETLNRRAQDEAFYDVTAISFHAYPYLQQNYALMGCGGRNRNLTTGWGTLIPLKCPIRNEHHPNDSAATEGRQAGKD